MSEVENMHSFSHKRSFGNNLKQASYQKLILQKLFSLNSFGHKHSLCHNLNCVSDQKTHFTKVVQFGSLSMEMSSEVQNMNSFCHKH